MPLTGKEMLRLLKKNGWKELRQEGSHHILEKDGAIIVVPVHANQDLEKVLSRES